MKFEMKDNLIVNEVAIHQELSSIMYNECMKELSSMNKECKYLAIIEACKVLINDLEILLDK